MEEQPKHTKDERTDQADLLSEGTTVSRRSFLKLAGVAGATIGVGAGLGGLVAACGSGTTTTTAAATSSSEAATTTTAAAATTSSAGAETTTSVSASAEKGREVKVGFVSPVTGFLATFGTADKYCVERWQEIGSAGIVLGDGKSHPINIVFRDCQSDPNRTSQVTGDLINNDKVDLMIGGSTPDTVIPLADQSEANATPCFTTDAPWEGYWLQRGGDKSGGFTWTYHCFWGLQDVLKVDEGLWKHVQTNKKVGVLWPNDIDGNNYADPKAGFPSFLANLGYEIVDPGRYQDGTEDYTTIIGKFKSAGVEIIHGCPIPPDFTNFWKQALQQGLKPKIVSISKAVDTPPDVEALGSGGNHFTLETQWTPRMPFKSSLTGENCQQVADDFEKRTGLQWTQYLLHYGLFEVVVDALKRTKDVESKEQIRDAIASTKLDTIFGPIDFTAPVKEGTMRPVKNVYRSPLVGGQWKKGTKHPYDLMVVDNSNYPGIAVESEMLPLEY